MGVVSIVPLAAGIAAMIVTRSLLVSAPRWLTLVVICVVASLCGPLVTQWLKRGNEDQIADLLLEEGLCPCCGYNLHGVAAASDQCIVCPECGAAWMAARVLRAEPFIGSGSTASIKQILGRTQSSDTGWTTVDARERRVLLAPARLRRSLRNAQADPAWQARLLSARRGVARGSLGTRLVGLAIVWSVSIGMVGVMIYVNSRHAGFGVGSLALVGVPAIALAAWATLGNFCFRPTVVRSALLAEGLCPSCTRPLDDAEVVEPEMVMCRTCRSAWRIDEMEAAARRHSPRAAEQEAVGT
jgi:Zn-finger nucleic acid-binding protein